MRTITRKEFLAKLDNYLEKEIKMKILGDIDLEIIFQKLDYEVKEDICTFRNKINNNYISINLNNINYMAADNKKIVCNLNDNLDSVVEIDLI